MDEQPKSCSLRVQNLRLPVEEPEESLRSAIARRLGIRSQDLNSFRILTKSLDARARDDLRFVYSVVVDVSDAVASSKSVARQSDIGLFQNQPFDDPSPGDAPLAHRPVVVGSGPAGLLAGYYLARKGYCPLIIERGAPVKERVPAIRLFDSGGPHDPENNYLFGEGGAGCFSDGKLTCRLSGPDVDWVLQAFVLCGGKPSLVYEHRPHLGSNKLPMICRNFRRKIESLGGEYRFNCRMEGLDISDGHLRGLKTSSGFIAATHVVLGTGHSARDTYQMLYELGVPMQQKAFQLGLRIEQPQEHVDRWKYGSKQYRDLLGAADYSLTSRGQRDVYTFCMCAGGVVIPSISEPEMFCTNGMSNSRHDTPFANSGLMVTAEPAEFGTDHPLAGVELQRKYESAAYRLGRGGYLCPIMAASDFATGKVTPPDAKLPSSYQRGTVVSDLRQVLPPSIVEAIRQSLPRFQHSFRGKFLPDATLVGPEMRGSSPVRIVRDNDTREVPSIAGLFPVGEGAGYAGGIVSAAVDGLRSAREIVRHMRPLGR